MYRTSALLRAMGGATLVLTLFGALWMIEALNTFTWIWIVFCVLVPAVLLVMRSIGLLLAAREARAAEPEETGENAAQGRALGRQFAWIFLVEFGLIALAANILQGTGRGDWTLAAIAAIVGLLLLPLARLFRFRVYYVTATAALAATAVLAWIARGRITAADPIFGLIMGLSLWLTVVVLLLQGARVAGQVSSEASGARG